MSTCLNQKPIPPVEIFNKDWDILLYHRTPVEMRDIDIHFSEEFNRKSCPTLDATFDKQWSEICKENDRLYNATKFRLSDVFVDKNGKTHIQVGMTDYKTSICTNQSSHVEELQRYGCEQYNDQQTCFSDPIAVNVVLETKDKMLVLIQRADWVAESKGMVDTPGGHAEPAEMLKSLNLSPHSDRYIYAIDKQHVRHEIFHSIIREIRDEVNIPEELVSWPLLYGIIRNPNFGGKPCLIFYCRCELNKGEVLKRYMDGGAEADESTDLFFLPLQELNLSDKGNKWTDFIGKMAPCGKAAVYFHHYSNY